MREGPMATIEGFMAALAVQDVEAALAYLAEAAVYVLHADPEVAGFGGEYRGKAEIRVLLSQLNEDWEVIEQRPGPWLPRTAGFAGRVTCRLRHRSSGLEYTDSRRFAFLVAPGGIVRCEETQDVARMRAFTEFVNWLRGVRAD